MGGQWAAPTRPVSLQGTLKPTKPPHQHEKLSYTLWRGQNLPSRRQPGAGAMRRWQATPRVDHCHWHAPGGACNLHWLPSSLEYQIQEPQELPDHRIPADLPVTRSQRPAVPRRQQKRGARTPPPALHRCRPSQLIMCLHTGARPIKPTPPDGNTERSNAVAALPPRRHPSLP